MAVPLYVTIDDLLPVVRSGDLVAFQQIYNRLATEYGGLSPDELTGALERLAPCLALRPQGVFARLALVAGAYVEAGGSAQALAAEIPLCTLQALRSRLKFSQLWPVVGGGRSEPDADHQPSMDEIIGLFEAAAGELNLSERETINTAIAWFDAPHWVDLMVTAMARREFRDAADLLPEIGEAAAQLANTVPRAHWLPGLAQVLDDEPLIVLDQTTGRGFHLTMSGVGDNYQLHTLLAHRLIGDPARGLLPGEPPAPAWVSQATTGQPRGPVDDPIQRRFRLFDGAGGYICPEGRPADIPLIDGVRVIMLHPPQGRYGWIGGRTYQHMVPTFTLDRIMTQDEATTWHTRIAPAQQTDLFARGKPDAT